MFKMVKQRGNGDCGIACLAMVLGKPYEEIKTYIDDTSEGTDSIFVKDVLTHYGKKNVREELHYKFGKPAILTVPSLNHPGLLHYIVCDGEKKWLDPSIEKRVYPNDGPIVNGRLKIYVASAIYWED